MEPAINAFAAILREMDARISALEATKKQENPAPPVPEVPLPDAPATEELFPLDNYGPDWIQDYLTSMITEATDSGKTFVFVSEATYRRVIGTSPEARADGTARNFRNATGGQVEIVLPGVADPLLFLLPGESGSIVFADNAWKNPNAAPNAWASLPTGGFVAVRRPATEEEQATFASEGAVIEVTGPDNEPISTQTNYVWYEAPNGKIGAACTHDRFFTSCDPASAPMMAVTHVLISVGGVDPSDAGVTYRVPIAIV
jgi:hypothetical protein